MSKKSLHNKAMDETPEDFEDMYKAHQPLIYRFLFWRAKDEMLAQDLTSKVFEKAWRTRKSFTGGSSKAWLYRIARTTLIDYWRKKKEILDDGTITSQVVSNSPEMSEVLDQSFELEKLHQALLRLPAEMYEVVRLRFIEGLSAREVAEELGISESNVRVTQYRALKKLRGYLE
jgi:RNA polymerase sigma-70 factor (ECF subfamily)